MAQVTWTLLDAQGNEIRTTDPFASQAEAELWMGSEWESLLEEGAEYVSLREDGSQIYRMGLREA